MANVADGFVQFSVQVPQELADRISTLAREQHRSRSAQVWHMCEEYFEAEDERAATAAMTS